MAEKIGKTFPKILKEVKPLPRIFEQKEVEQADRDHLFYFHIEGDFLYGRLSKQHVLECIHYDMVIYTINAYEGRQDGVNLQIGADGQQIQFPANVKMRQIIEDHELLGSFVKIVYSGKRGRYKLYRVYKDTGIFTKNEEQKHERRRKKRRKNPKARPVRA